MESTGIISHSTVIKCLEAQILVTGGHIQKVCVFSPDLSPLNIISFSINDNVVDFSIVNKLRGICYRMSGLFFKSTSSCKGQNSIKVGIALHAYSLL
jgi:hypothetical protein